MKKLIRGERRYAKLAPPAVIARNAGHIQGSKKRGPDRNRGRLPKLTAYEKKSYIEIDAGSLFQLLPAGSLKKRCCWKNILRGFAFFIGTAKLQSAPANKLLKQMIENQRSE